MPQVDPERRLHVVREIISDCETDMLAMQGQPLTGKNVAKWFAETLATLQALAKIVESMLVEQKEVQDAQ